MILLGSENVYMFFPLFLNLDKKNILVIGGGKIAERRITTLCEYGANITVISPIITDNLQILCFKNKIQHVTKVFEKGEIKKYNPFIVIATTDNREVNNSIMIECNELNILHIISDCKEDCDVYFPAIIENNNYIAGLISKKGRHKEVKDLAKQLRSFLNGE